MHPRQDSRIPLEEIIRALTTNNPRMKELDFRSILMNPIDRYEFGSSHTISNIGDEELLLLAEAIEQNTTLQRFVICDLVNERFNRWGERFSNTWTEIGSEAIGNALRNHTTLKSVSLTINIGRVNQASRFGFLRCLTGSAKIETLELFISTTVNLSTDPDVYLQHSPEMLNKVGEFLLELQHPCLKRIFIQGTSFGHVASVATPISFSTFARGLAPHKDIETIHFQSLPLGDTGIEEVASHLLEPLHVCEEKEALHLKLKTIKFANCGIQNAMDGVVSLAVNSPNLDEFELSGDVLQEEAAIKIINCLPILQKLTVLNLSRIQMSNETLSHLVTTYSQHNLNIIQLNISGNPIDKIDPSTELVQKLIRGNKTLKVLDMSYSGFNHKRFEKLAPILMDPDQCQLEEFDFGGSGPFTLNTRKMVANILYKNEFLCNLGGYEQHSPELRIAYKINRQKKYLRAWNNFIDMALLFFNARFSKNNGSSFKLPADAISLMLLFLAPRTPLTKENSSYLCINLIRQNLAMRAQLMENKKYNPREDLKKDAEKNNRQIITSTWWSYSLLEKQTDEPAFNEEKKAEPRFLFFPREIISPNLIRLPDLLNIISSYLSSAQSETSPHDAENVLIDLSHLLPGKQRYIQAVFSQFFLLMNRHNDNITTMNIDETGKLRINGVALSDLKESVRQYQMSVFEGKTSRCSLM